MAGRQRVRAWPDDLLRLLDAYGVSTLPDLARAMGQGVSTVKNWAARGGVPSEALKVAAKDTGRSLDWFTFGASEGAEGTEAASTFLPNRADKLKHRLPDQLDADHPFVALQRLQQLYGASSQAELAEKLQTTLAEIKAWEQQRMVPLPILLRAVDEQDCSLDWLTGLRMDPGSLRWGGASYKGRRVAGAQALVAREAIGTALLTPDESLDSPGVESHSHSGDDSLHYGGRWEEGAADEDHPDPVVLRLFGVEYCFVPRYRPRPVVGRVAQNEEREAPGELAFDATWMRRTFGRIGDFCLVEVEGRNMEPTFHVGDLLLVDRMSRNVGADGGLYAIRHGTSVTVRRMFALQNGSLQLISDNMSFPTETLERPLAARLEIVGQVTLQVTRRP